jgi:hypothetical protein
MLVVGGARAARPDPPVERYDVTSSTWSPVAGLGTPRTGHSATALSMSHSGQVLVVGGRSPGGDLLAPAELYTDIPPSYKPPPRPRPGPATPGASPAQRGRGIGASA